MVVTCINAGDGTGTGSGLLTLGRKYKVISELGGYYCIQCDDGKVYSKCKSRFK